MSVIVLVDTSVFLNVVDVPGRNQQRESVLTELDELIDAGDLLFIPMAAIIETGNHIAHMGGDGRLRRQASKRFVDVVRAALNDEAPWKPINFPADEHVLTWLGEFPDFAMRGISMGDLSIHKEWEQLCTKYSMSRVRVWSVDGDLTDLDRRPR
ncbi:MAG: hypothetical protein KAX88_05150 [Rhodoferax sp.]|nr:hypothetical protein [Rhodoferax sp.]